MSDRGIAEDDLMPFDRSKYPDDWERIVSSVAARARGRCECSGECGKHSGSCRAVNHHIHPNTGSLVVLTTAHLWRGPCREHHGAGIKCGDLEHLKHLCQRCHLAYDRELHTFNARRTRFESKAHADLFSGPHPANPSRKQIGARKTTAARRSEIGKAAAAARWRTAALGRH